MTQEICKDIFNCKPFKCDENIHMEMICLLNNQYDSNQLVSIFNETRKNEKISTMETYRQYIDLLKSTYTNKATLSDNKFDVFIESVQYSISAYEKLKVFAVEGVDNSSESNHNLVPIMDNLLLIEATGKIAEEVARSKFESLFSVKEEEEKYGI